MPQNTNQTPATSTNAPVREPLSVSVEARRAAAVEAAYILEARTR
ncbi:MAG TPA: hypothetical protein VHW67_03725 [Solirubrobacteraceae bacterium]|nr:hypothetical protein [Solirubrobacteraceae bacterium]